VIVSVVRFQPCISGLYKPQTIVIQAQPLQLHPQEALLTQCISCATFEQLRPRSGAIATVQRLSTAKMSSSSNDSLHAPAADGGEGSHPQSGSASTARRVPADGRRDLQRRSSWEVADDYNRRIWLRQAGGAA
jgi:hypothetical protein